MKLKLVAIEFRMTDQLGSCKVYRRSDLFMTAALTAATSCVRCWHGCAQQQRKTPVT